MTKIDSLKGEAFVAHATDEARKNRMAADDLRHIEEETKQEAEVSAQDFNDEGDEARSIEAADAAFDFDEAERLTNVIKAQF